MYKRFLNNADYLGIITQEHLDQLIMGRQERFANAEEAAEASIIEYLTENYEIERVLNEGKSVEEYNRQITYPAGAYFYYKGVIHRATRTINGYKHPINVLYWEENFDGITNESEIPMYSQKASYAPGDRVRFANTFYICREYNGKDFSDVVVPGIEAWELAEHSTWAANQIYSLWEAVRYEDSFYALIDANNVNWSINPHDSDNWGLIGTYDPEYNKYDLESGTDYVEYDGVLYLPSMNPNSDELMVGYNITPHDPRHPNIKKHLLRLALYELHKLVSPNNISSSRTTDYETSIMWLRDAAKLRINPQLPRKLDEQKKSVTDYALATFQRDYDPYKNPWQT
jgi:hypothetical protein